MIHLIPKQTPRAADVSIASTGQLHFGTDRGRRRQSQTHWNLRAVNLEAAQEKGKQKRTETQGKAKLTAPKHNPDNPRRPAHRGATPTPQAAEAPPRACVPGGARRGGSRLGGGAVRRGGRRPVTRRCQGSAWGGAGSRGWGCDAPSVWGAGGEPFVRPLGARWAAGAPRWALAGAVRSALPIPSYPRSARPGPARRCDWAEDGAGRMEILMTVSKIASICTMVSEWVSECGAGPNWTRPDRSEESMGRAVGQSRDPWVGIGGERS